MRPTLRSFLNTNQIHKSAYEISDGRVWSHAKALGRHSIPRVIMTSLRSLGNKGEQCLSLDFLPQINEPQITEVAFWTIQLRINEIVTIFRE